MSTSAAASGSGTAPLPADDPTLFELDLRGLRQRWADRAALAPIGAEAMRGADRRAQALGVSEERLMEHAGTAVAAAVKALAVDTGRWGKGPIVILAGPGNNGGDGHVAARHLAAAGIRSVVALASTDPRPGTRDAALNWDRLDGIGEVDRLHLASAHDARLLLNGIERAGLVIDALLGTGVRGALREPILSAVDVCLRARSVGVPVLAVDTPTAVDPTSGAPSDPAVRADVTITFHRPRTGLRTRTGSRLAGRVLVAPIGIPPLADRP
jgi:NAD(P)H-hydrate epimerase